jgi:hypothetical protein
MIDTITAAPIMAPSVNTVTNASLAGAAEEGSI